MVKKIEISSDNIRFDHNDGSSDQFVRLTGEQTWEYSPADGGEVTTISDHDMNSKLISAQTGLLQFSAPNNEAENPENAAPEASSHHQYAG